MGETYVVMYQHEASSMLDESNAEGILYGSNGFDIADSLGNPNAVSMDDVNRLFGTTTEDNLNINVPAFGVTFGRQSQSMFKDIKVNMDGPRVTDFSIANTFELGKLGANGFAREPYSVGQDMFAIYSNRSYNCEVEMMGCANIFPFMYFQLNNVPMFKGAYIITDVKHSIAPGDMKTKFTGVRVSKNQIPFNTDIFNIRSFLAMIDGYVKNGGRYDKPSLTVSSGVAMGGDGSGDSSASGTTSVIVNVPTTQKKYVDMNTVIQECHEGWYRRSVGGKWKVRNRTTSINKGYKEVKGTCTEGPKTWYEDGFKKKVLVLDLKHGPLTLQNVRLVLLVSFVSLNLTQCKVLIILKHKQVMLLQCFRQVAVNICVCGTAKRGFLTLFSETRGFMVSRQYTRQKKNQKYGDLMTQHLKKLHIMLKLRRNS